MSSYDQGPLDWSGYGPTGYGNAPTAREMRQQAMNRHHTNRMAMGMQYMDPSLVSAAQQMMRLKMGDKSSTSAVRRELFSTASGQAMLDAAQFGRQSGMLGYGDPVNFANNIAQGVAGSGFGMSFSGNMGGKQVYGGGAVTGQGNISERVSQSFAKNIMGGIFKGEGNPMNAHGFDQEEVSGVFKTLARRGTIGNVANMKMDASLGERVAAARDAAIDPTIKDGLSSLNVGKNATETEVSEALDKLSNSTESKKMKREIEAIKGSTTAVVINQDEVSRVTAMVEKVTEGIASLSDVYGELSGPALLQKMETLTGQKITTGGQAARAKRMVEDMRGTAIQAGIDPRVYMDIAMQQRDQLRGQVYQRGGFDGMSSDNATGVTANMQVRAQQRSVIQAKTAGANVQALRDLGIKGVSNARSAEEYYAEDIEGRTKALDTYRGMTTLVGGMDNLSGASREQAEAMKAEFMQAKKDGDTGKMRTLTRQAEGLVSKVASYGTGKHISFENASKDKLWQNATQRATEDSEYMDSLGNQIGSENFGAVGMRLAEMGIGGGEKGTLDEAKNLAKTLGVGGLADIAKNSAGKFATDKDRREAQMKVFNAANMTQDQRDSFMKNYMNPDGTLKDAEGMKGVAKLIHEGGAPLSEHDKNKAMEAEYQAALDEGSRKKITKTGLSLRSIGKHLLGGGGMDDETQVMALEAMGDSLPDELKDKFASGIDFTDEIKATDLDKLDKLAGEGGIDLASKLGFESREAMLAATKGEAGKKARLKAFKMLKDDEDFAKLNIGGGMRNMTAITDDAKKNLHAQDLADKAMGTEILGDIMGLNEDDVNSITKSGKFDKDKFKAGKSGKRGWFGSKTAEMGGRLKRNRDLAAVMNSGDLRKINGLMAVSNDGEDVTDVLTNQRDALVGMQEDGREMIKGKDGKEENISAVIKELENAIKVANMGVINAEGATTAKRMVIEGDLIINGTKQEGE